MIAVQGYFDGSVVRPMETLAAKPNQRVIITVMDEFVEMPKKTKKMDKERLRKIEELRGCLSAYANPALIPQEKEAWERAAVEKHGHL